MVNSNEEETQELNTNQNIEPSASLPSLNKGSFNKNNVILGFTSIIALIALLVATYTIQLNVQLQNKQVEEHIDLSDQITQLKESVIKNQEQLDLNSSSSVKNQDSLQNDVNHLKNQLQTSLSQLQYKNQDWILLKARYYLELAQVNTNWSDNFKATLALLRLTDDLLKQITDPQILPIRQAIAKEITQIKALPNVDIAGLLSQLDAAQISVENLSAQSTVDPNKIDTADDSSNTANSPAWKLRLQNSLKLLEKLVVIRRDNEDVKPLLSPLFESILKESIRLNLQQAQWAILNHNPAVYQLALKQATSNINRVFNTKDKPTIELLKQLTSLQQVQLIQEKPVIGQTLPLLNQLIESKETLLKPVNNNAKGDSTP